MRKSKVRKSRRGKSNTGKNNKSRLYKNKRSKVRSRVKNSKNNKKRYKKSNKRNKRTRKMERRMRGGMEIEMEDMNPTVKGPDDSREDPDDSREDPDDSMEDTDITVKVVSFEWDENAKKKRGRKGAMLYTVKYHIPTHVEKSHETRSNVNFEGQVTKRWSDFYDFFVELEREGVIFDEDNIELSGKSFESVKNNIHGQYLAGERMKELNTFFEKLIRLQFEPRDYVPRWTLVLYLVRFLINPDNSM